MRNRVTSLDRQTGVVLMVSLIMLILLTLIGLTGTQVTSLEERMAGNARDQNVAFQAAESTLLYAELYARASPNNAAFYNGTGGRLDSANLEPDYFSSTTWETANSVNTPANFGNNFGVTNPRFVIHRFDQLPSGPPGPSGDKTYFRITARAVGSNAGTQVILQEIFEREEP